VTTSQYLSALNPSDAISRSADVVIIGAGPAGAAAAWALHRAQPDLSLVIVERAATIGAGSSRASLENFRTCWACIPLASIMRRSVDVIMNADDEIGVGAREAIHPRQRGYLWCAFDERGAAALRADVDHLREMDMAHIAYLDSDEVAYRYGWLGRGVIAAKHDPTAGWLDSNALVQHLIAASRGRVLLDAGDVTLRVESGKVTGVDTAAGAIAAPNVLLAAGAWSIGIAAAAGLTLPIVIRPRQSFTTGWRHETFPDDAPTLISSAPFPHVRPEAQSGAIFGWEYRWHRKHAPPAAHAADFDDALAAPVFSLDTLKDPRFPSVTLALMARQFGHAAGQGFADPRYLRSLRHNIGYYVYRSAAVAYRTADDGSRVAYDSERAILDAHPDVGGLYLSLAHVGHGIMSAPAAGEVIARKLLGLPPVAGLDDGFALATAWVAHDENAL
jgi:glycine/D-amino acid oxidase-like deaminating enzyme